MNRNDKISKIILERLERWDEGCKELVFKSLMYDGLDEMSDDKLDEIIEEII